MLLIIFFGTIFFVDIFFIVANNYQRKYDSTSNWTGGVDISMSLTATGGNGAYNWSLVSSSSNAGDDFSNITLSSGGILTFHTDVQSSNSFVVNCISGGVTTQATITVSCTLAAHGGIGVETKTT